MTGRLLMKQAAQVPLPGPLVSFLAGSAGRCRRCLLWSSLTHPKVRSLRSSSAPRPWPSEPASDHVASRSAGRCRRCLLRSSLTHLQVRSLRSSSAPRPRPSEPASDYVAVRRAAHSVVGACASRSGTSGCARPPAVGLSPSTCCSAGSGRGLSDPGIHRGCPRRRVGRWRGRGGRRAFPRAGRARRRAGSRSPGRS